MALTPERIKELQGYASGGQQSQPSVQPAPQPSSGGILSDEAGDWGVTSAAKSLTRNVLSFPISAAKTMLMPSINMSQRTMKLVADFGEKHLGADNPFVDGFRTAEKNIDYNKQLAFNTGTLGKTSENFGGRVGGFVGEVAPYFANQAKTLPGRVAYDTGVSYYQTGSPLIAAQTGLVSAATGLLGPLTQATSKLLRGGKTKPVTDIITKTDIAKKYLSSVAKGTATGYVAGTTQNLAEGEGAEAFIPDVTSLVGGVIGGVQGVKPLRANLQTRHLQQTERNIDGLVNSFAQGKIADVEKTKSAISQFTPDEISNIKTYKDAPIAINSKINDIETAADKVYDRSPIRKKLNDLSIVETATTRVGEVKTPTNYVKNALQEMKAFYTKIGDKIKLGEINLYIKKAELEGFNSRDVNELAKMHGRDLVNFNESTGKLPSGLTQDAAEITRSGLKTTSRKMTGDINVEKALEVKDQAVSDLLNMKRLMNNAAEKVNKFEQTANTLGFSARAANAIKYTAYGIKFAIAKALSGAVTTEASKLNPNQMEKILKESLLDANKILTSSKSENEIIKELDVITKKFNMRIMLDENKKGFQSQFAKAKEQVGNTKGTRLLPAPSSNFQGKPIALPGESTKTVGQRETTNYKTYPKSTPKPLLQLPAPKPVNSVPLKPNQSYTGGYSTQDKAKIKNDTGGYERKSPLLKRIKDIPNKQGGSIRISGVEANNIHPDDVKILKKVKASSKITDLSNADYNMYSSLGERFGISMDLPLPKMKKMIDDILSGKVKVKGTLLPGSLKKQGMTAINPLTVGAAVGLGVVGVKQELDKKRKLLKKE